MKKLNLSNNSILFLKNIPVYDINKNVILDKERVPGLLRRSQNTETFKQWLKYRYSSNTNSFARVLKGVTFGQGNRIAIDQKTHIFSLSDSYWIADTINSTITFEDFSPYFADFWKGEGEYSGGSIPTLYANGFLSKCWISSTDLYKTGESVKIEVECSKLSRLCQIPCAEVIETKDGIIVKNFTSKDVMLESADMSGRIDPDDFDEQTIIELFGFSGFQMILLDAIFGNGDRHAGNFGFLRDTNTGKYLGMAPLYDFDHALDAKGINDRLILDAIEIAKSSIEFSQESIRVCEIIEKNTSIEIFKKRASVIKSKL